MKRPTREQLEQLEKSELIDLIFALMDEIDALKGEVAQLRSEIEALKKPQVTSKNSSNPSSRDFKGNRDSGAIKSRKRGAQDGHAMMRRELVEQPDRVIECTLGRCACGADVSSVAPSEVIRRQITELPQIRPVVIETRQAVGMCPCCGKRVAGELPAGLEAERVFGPRLEATLTYLQHQQHMSYERTQNAMDDLFGVTISQGGIACVSERAGEAAGESAQAIQQAVQASPVIKSDETSARVDGRNWWEWVFVGLEGVLHLIRPSRGEDVIVEAMGSVRAQAWVSDCWAPQLRSPADKRQLCLAHQIRNLQGLIERAPRLRWAPHAYAAIASVVDTAKLRGSPVFDALFGLFGPPILPFVTAQRRE